MSDDKSENEKKEESSNSHSPAFDGDKKIVKLILTRWMWVILKKNYLM